MTVFLRRSLRQADLCWPLWRNKIGRGPPPGNQTWPFTWCVVRVGMLPAQVSSPLHSLWTSLYGRFWFEHVQGNSLTNIASFEPLFIRRSKMNWHGHKKCSWCVCLFTCVGDPVRSSRYVCRTVPEYGFVSSWAVHGSSVTVQCIPAVQLSTGMIWWCVLGREEPASIGRLKGFLYPRPLLALIS